MALDTLDPKTDSQEEVDGKFAEQVRREFTPEAIKSIEERAATGGTVKPGSDSDDTKAGLAPSITSDTDSTESETIGGKMGGLFKEAGSPLDKAAPELAAGKKVAAGLIDAVKNNPKKSAAGGGIAAGIIALFFLFGSVAITNELNSVMTTMINHFFGTAELDVSKETDKLIDSYIKKRILKRLGPGCESSANFSEECMQKESTPDADPTTDPVDAFDEALDKYNMPQKLADAGFTFTMDADGTLRLHADGLPSEGIDVTKYLDSDDNILDDPAFNQATSDNLNSTVDELAPAAPLEEAGGALIHEVLPPEVAEDGADMCAMDCDPGNEAADEAADTPAEQADFALAQAGEAQDIAGSAAADGMEDLLNTNSNPDDNSTVDPATGTPENALEVQTSQDAEQLATKFGSEKLATLLASANTLKTEAGDAVAQAMADALSTITGDDISGEALSEAFSSLADKLAGPVAWVQLAAQALYSLSTLATKLRVINYLVHIEPAVFMFVKFAASLSEQKSGGDHVSLLEMGSEVKSLSSNGSNASQSEWYQTINDPNNTPSDVTSSSINTELTGEKVSVNHYSNLLTSASDGANSIPGFNYLADAAGLVSKIIGYAFMPVSWILNWITSVTHVNGLIGLAAGALMKFMVSELVGIPNLVTAGGKTTYDVLALGSDKTGNQLATGDGGETLSPTKAGALTDEQEKLQMQNFQQQPIFARIFSTDTPYSLVSKLSLDMPLNFGSALQGTMADIMSNPFSQVFHSFSTIFTSGIAHAATAGEADPAGITQTGIPTADPVFATDPGTYWTQNNCAQQEAQGWPIWNSAANTSINPDTGQVEHNTTNGCLLIINSTKAAGAIAGYTGS